jgi:drug/metabolite transporter (DMT)-like permease
MGALLCLTSAAAFATLGVFGKLAYDEGVGVTTLLSVRFVLAALAFGVLAAVLRPPAPPRATVRTALLLGGVGYATQAGLFFAALERLDASLLTLCLYTYPAWVVLASLALRRERASRARLAALALSSAGLVLALAGAATGALDAVGAVLGVGSALTYATYILVSDRVVGSTDPVALSALVTGGAAVTLTAVAVLAGGPDLGFTAEGWLWLGLIAAVSTVLAVLTFFAGLARVGPPAAAILSTLEPVVTVVLAAAVFGEVLTPVQLAGAALVLGAAVLVVVSGPPRAAGAGPRGARTATTGSAPSHPPAADAAARAPGRRGTRRTPPATATRRGP